MTETTNLVKTFILDVFPKESIYKFRNPNPSIPKMSGFPKIHKTGNKFRPLVANPGSPTEKVAKWLVWEMKGLPDPDNAVVKNSLELINDIKDVKLEKNDILISFDVVSLFPSVPLDETIDYMRSWLKDSGVPDEHVNSYIKLTEHCVNNNYFLFDGEVYKQTEGLSMGSPLSPVLANLFMSFLESELKKFSWFPKIWKRYVDDIFCIVKEQDVDIILDKLNSQHETIKFTVEREIDGILPFLDLKIIRNGENLEFDVYRKPTTTSVFIPYDSNHNYSHKMSAFSSMIHRLLNVPLNTVRYTNELNHIKKLAQINGYNNNTIERLLINKKKKKERSDLTKLTPLKDNRVSSFMSIYYENKNNNDMRNILKKVDIGLVNKNRFKLRNLLGTAKDKTPTLEMSGIYKINCNDCNMSYIGQTRRSVKIRYSEHEAHTRLGHSSKSAVAEHMLSNQHKFNIENVKLLKSVPNPYHLDAWESLYINNSNNLMNKEDAPINSFLLQGKNI